MKDRRIVLAALAALPVAGCASMAPAAPSKADLVDSARSFHAGVSKRDIAAIDALCVKDARAYVSHPGSRAPIVGWDAVRKSWENTFANTTELAVAMPSPHVEVMGDVGIVAGVETIHSQLPNGSKSDFQAVATDVWVREGGRWMLMHHHSTRMPPPAA